MTGWQWRRSGSLLAASLIATTLAALLATDRAYLATACDGNADGGRLRIGDWTKARQWLSNYLATDRQDVKSRRLLEQLTAAGK